MTTIEVAKKAVVTTFETLPLEIRTEILSRLDSKTLALFRCVSKPMSSLVSTPDVISAHRLRSLQNPLLLFVIYSRSTESYNLVSFDILTATTTHLITLQNSRSHNVILMDNKLEAAAVLNLLTKYTQSLPPSFLDANHHQMIHGQTLLHCNTSYSAFVYVASDKRYKALRVLYMYFSGLPRLRFGMEVFTLGVDEEWRRAVCDLPASTYLAYPAAVDHTLYYLSRNDFVISKFDLEREEWSMFPPLPFMIKSCCNSKLKGLKGSLCLIVKDRQLKHIDVWVLKNVDTYSWSQEYRIDMSVLVISKTQFSQSVDILSVEGDGRILIFLNFDKPTLMYHDPKNMQFEQIDLREKGLLGRDDRLYHRPTFYVDSFF